MAHARIPDKWETAILIIIGLLAGALAALRPSFAVASALIVSFAIACLACWFVWHRHVWFDWMVPAAIQMPLGLAWSVGSYLLSNHAAEKNCAAPSGFICRRKWRTKSPTPISI